MGFYDTTVRHKSYLLRLKDFFEPVLRLPRLLNGSSFFLDTLWLTLLTRPVTLFFKEDPLVSDESRPPSSMFPPFILDILLLPCPVTLT